MAPAVKVSNLSKRFRIPHLAHTTLKDRVLHPLDRTTYTEFDALEDVSFSVHHGEFFGIVGRNGSGKSTLLKIISGIYQQDSGTIEIDGSLASFIELGVGFNPDLTGRDNLFINGALVGMSKRQLLDRYDAIVEFAGLAQFMDMKLRNFSSGMQVRLAFSIAIETGADILITDEVFAVGDENFQQKCYEVFQQRKQDGKTAIFVSHDMETVTNMCDRVMVLDAGRGLMTGSPDDAVREYRKLNGTADDAHHKIPNRTVVVEDAWVEDEIGERTDTAPPDALMTLRVRAHSTVSMPMPQFRVSLIGEQGIPIGCLQSESHSDIHEICPGERVEISFSFANNLARGAYSAEFTAGSTEIATDLYAAQLFPGIFSSLGHTADDGLIRIPHNSTVEVHAAPSAALPVS
jgi:ABC-type polysaccharide/polyol phosphate transport system ATPase subunit